MRAPTSQTGAWWPAVVTPVASSGVSARSLDSAIGGCYSGGGLPSRIVQPLVIQRPSLRRPLGLSLALHAVAAILAWTIGPAQVLDPELVDIEVAPPPPRPEALPAEVAKPPDQGLTGHEPEAPDPAHPLPDQPGWGMIDAGSDAAPDARPDAPIDARPDARPDAPIDARPDAPIDAGLDAEVASPDGGVPDDATPPDAQDTLTVASTAAEAPGREDAGAAGAASDAGGNAGQVASAAAGSAASPGAPADAGDSAQVALGSGAGSGTGSGASASSGTGAGSGAGAGTGSGAGSGSGSGSAEGPPLDTAALAAALAAGSAVPGATNEPAVEGEPTTAGTAANLLAYFPEGHVVTALIRFDRLRGTEWAAPTERLLRPLPDYQLLFGARAAGITDKLETLVISSPRPRDATATTLVARTTLTRAELRGLLGAATPVTWSAARGGLLGKRTSKLFPGDQRVFLSPFQGWFLLAQPADLGTLTGAARGSPDAALATAKLLPWLAGIRKIEAETGEPRGPALVVTLGLGGKRVDLTGNDFGLGIPSVPTPERVSLAMELVKQGWLVRGNMRFASDADAAELIASVQRVQQRVTGSYLIQRIVGKPLVHVIANLAFARSGPRVSYATSISIADARAILAATAQQLDQYFAPSFPHLP